MKATNHTCRLPIMHLNRYPYIHIYRLPNKHLGKPEIHRGHQVHNHQNLTLVFYQTLVALSNIFTCLSLLVGVLEVHLLYLHYFFATTFDHKSVMYMNKNQFLSRSRLEYDLFIKDNLNTISTQSVKI